MRTLRNRPSDGRGDDRRGSPLAPDGGRVPRVSPGDGGENA